MKLRKILFLMLSLSLLCSCIPFPASADSAQITVSADYSTLYIDHEQYTRVASDEIYLINEEDFTSSVAVESADGRITSCDVWYNGSAAELYVCYESGGSGVYYFVKTSMLADYYAFASGRGDSFEIELYSGNIELSRAELFGKETRFAGYELNYYPFFASVSSECFDGDISSLVGYIVSDGNGNFYYVDYKLSVGSQELDMTIQKELTVWQITDSELVDTLIAADNSLFSDGYTDIDDGIELGMGFGLIFLAVVLGIVPLVGAIAMLILSFKASKGYKLPLRVASALCVAAFAVTLITVIICLIIAV